MTDHSTFVIFGATGDLTRRLLFPAIYRLYAQGEWAPTRIIAYAKEDWSASQFLTHVENNLKSFAPIFDANTWERLKASVTYRSGDLQAHDLKQLAPDITGPAVFYLALPPQLFAQAAKGLGEAGFNDQTNGWRRLVVEKPFGWDLESAQTLGNAIAAWWAEDQIFRIDHFLGKDTAQNVLVFRFVNRLLESVWNGAHIAQVQITYAETLGLEGRWQYYDKAGALRDMLQNHLLQLFALVAMEPPSGWAAEELHNHKAEVLRAVRALEADSAVAGQYGPGTTQGQAVPGYVQENGIAADSQTETYAALKLHVDNWRWHGVPFYLRSGKRLAADYAEIAIQLKPVPRHLFGAGLADWLVFRMKPDEAIDLVMFAKKPGLEMDTKQVTLSAPYKKAGEHDYSAYEQLLLDVLSGEQSAFPRWDEVEQSWRIVDPILKAWANTPPEVYPAGSQGPRSQDRLMEAGLQWRPLPS
ncbi:glucose-6-phosphate dehydrogenase [Sulfobacillus sp. hq2]|uniref:glucose-6-phosphate dehydrogenase n=1 Tax=Sulfobacillus sp. hq2 TaxID=2039167 RepID=UPI000CD025FD|nr:glucose-6-phosphate dehydrogenase [Sulfobacillus sp. hq2]POB09845.1 glucose-6-phosphate dehydrogenase [Sulfobacillus sp. hq2]